MSYIDDIRLDVTLNKDVNINNNIFIKIYSKSYNILKSLIIMVISFS